MVALGQVNSRMKDYYDIAVLARLFEPWRGVFYPPGLPQKRELEFASRAVSSIEINGTFYSTFRPETWCKWRDETPDDFVFAVKASRYSTNRKVLAEAGAAIERFSRKG